MKRLLTCLCLLAAVLSGCAAQAEDPYSEFSPDKKYAVLAATELDVPDHVEPIQQISLIDLAKWTVMSSVITSPGAVIAVWMKDSSRVAIVQDSNNSFSSYHLIKISKGVGYVTEWTTDDLMKLIDRINPSIQSAKEVTRIGPVSMKWDSDTLRMSVGYNGYTCDLSLDTGPGKKLGVKQIVVDKIYK